MFAQLSLSLHSTPLHSIITFVTRSKTNMAIHQRLCGGGAAATAARMAGMAKAMAAIEGKGRQAREAAAATGGIHNESDDPLSRQFPLP